MSKRLGLVIDQERCIGCDCCTIACQIENKGLKGYINVETQNSLFKDTPIGAYPNLTMDFLPKVCNHCENPPCVESCPVEALIKREDGIVHLDEELCIGCQSCLTACPYNAISFNEASTNSEKCNLCSHRIDEGLEPFCVICCEGQAIFFGDLNDSESEVSHRIKDREGYQLNPEYNTNPSIYYCPPIKKRPL